MGDDGAMSFRDLHHRDAPLILPNAWDHASAVVLLRAGFPAIGTTSLVSRPPAGSPTQVEPLERRRGA